MQDRRTTASASKPHPAYTRPRQYLRAAPMQITNVEIFPLTSQRPTLRVGEPIHPSWWGYDQTIIKVHTDGGPTGWGCAGVRWEMAEAVMKVLCRT